LTRIGEVIAHARATSSFYAQTWGAAEVRSWDQFSALPIVTKNQMLRHAGGPPMIADARVGFSTRGTSGNPLVLWLDGAEAEAYLAPTARGFGWAGLAADQRALILSPSWHRLAAMEGHAVARLGAHPCYFWGTLTDPAHAESFVDALQDFQPEFLTSTPPFILNVLKHCEDRRLDIASLFAPVRSVVLAGLALTPGLRRYLSQRLDADVFERGGTQEGAALDECAHHVGMHVHEDVCLLEVLDKQGNALPEGQIGRLVITKLVAAGSPFVRYDTGDTARLQPGACACGSGFARLRIVARPESTIMIEGRAITGFDLRCLLDEDPELVGRASLLVRDTTARDTLRILIDGNPAGRDPVQTIREHFGISDVRIDWMGGTGLVWGFRQVIDVRELKGRHAP
jgi:phenylacetate-CoA ligase